MSYVVFSSTGGEKPAETLAQARQIAATMAHGLPSFDSAQIFEWLAGCGECMCGGQIHPQSVLVEEIDGGVAS